MPNRSYVKSLDWITFSIYLALVGIGWAMIYTVGYPKGGYTGGFGAFLNTPVGKQLIWVGITLAVFFISYVIDWKFWRNFAHFIYAGCLFSLVLVLIFGKEINGARAWFDFGGGMTLQPSEFAKFGTCLALASYLGSYTTNLKIFQTQLYAVSFMLAPMLLMMLQPDAGSALVFLSLFLMLYREGFPGGILVVGLLISALLLAGLVVPPGELISILLVAGACFLLSNFNRKALWYGGLAALTVGSIVVLYLKLLAVGYVLGGAMAILLGLSAYQWFIKRKQMLAGLVLLCVFMASNLAYIANYAFNHFLKKHQQERINVWLAPSKADPQGAAYNLNHSKMAIGSGGLLGKGFLDGNLTQGNFVPEQITDFIFSAIGEEQGFVGVVVIISLFVLLMMRIQFIAERQRSEFNRVYAYGVLSILFIHFLINIGMTMGLMPVIGIPLPFLSKGGSSLLGFTMMISILLKLDANRS